jgi:hypothetical protein
MRTWVEARTITGEPSFPLSQRTRATSRQRPAPTSLRRGIQSSLNRPLRRVLVFPIRNAFWAERSERRTVRLQNSITGQPLPLMTSVSPKWTGLGRAVTLWLAAAGAARSANATTVTRVNRVGKVWVLDTDTKGTGAEMVPLEKTLKRPEPDAAPPRRRAPKKDTPAHGARPKRSRKAVSEKTVSDLPAGHVRKKATGEIGRIVSVDAKAGTATVHWLKRGAASTVPLSAISRR